MIIYIYYMYIYINISYDIATLNTTSHYLFHPSSFTGLGFARQDVHDFYDFDEGWHGGKL